MFQFLFELQSRNKPLFYFSALLFLLSIIFYLLAKVSTIKVAGVNAWFKPFKFACSISIYCATIAWFCYRLPNFNIDFFNWANIGLFGFELGYITIQAARSQESHFNWSTSFYRIMFGGMAIAAIAITSLAVYACMAYFRAAPIGNPSYYNWAVRLSILIFIIFSLEGILIGGRQTHTIGRKPQTTFLPLLKWNMREGDLRVAHFIGMHALQIIPLLSFYLLKNTAAVFILSAIYLFFAVYVLIQALQSKPFIHSKKLPHETVIERKAIPEK